VVVAAVVVLLLLANQISVLDGCGWATLYVVYPIGEKEEEEDS